MSDPDCVYCNDTKEIPIISNVWPNEPYTVDLGEKVECVCVKSENE